MRRHHYTDKKGYNGIRSTVVWCFYASQPPCENPFGAYFTTLGPATKNLALRLRIPRMKLEYVFMFEDKADLLPLRGQRGEYIFYSPKDYLVDGTRPRACGESAKIEADPSAGSWKT